MKKRILACLLSVLMLFASWPAIAAEDTVVLTVIAPDAPVEQEQAFSVTIELANNHGIGSLEMTLVYDREKMECVDIVSKDVMREMMSVSNPNAENGAMIAAISATNMVANGTIALCKFIAKEAITDYDLNLSGVVLADADGVVLPFEVFIGSSQQEAEPAPEEDEEVLPEEEDEGSTVTPSRPSVSGGGQGGTVAKQDKEETITPESEEEKPKEDPEEEIFEMAEEIPDVIIHLFGDTSDHWAEAYINKAVDAGFFKGDDKGNFNPDANITRAQFITVLWRMAGSPESNVELPFTDVSDLIPEFQAAIRWGYEKGYINGVSETAFNPGGTLTREAGMKILHYYSGGKTGNEFMFIDVYDNAFEDSKNISSWAKMSMYWGVYNKLISGVTSTQLAPGGVATRAQIAKILVDYRDSFN